MTNIKKVTALDTSKIQLFFLIATLSVGFACFVIVYLHDSKIVILDDPTWYKILLFSSFTSAGSYLFGSGTARK